MYIIAFMIQEIANTRDKFEQKVVIHNQDNQNVWSAYFDCLED